MAKKKAAKKKRSTVKRPATPAAQAGEMVRVRLTTGRVGTGFANEPGQIIEVPAAEARTLIDGDNAVPVTEAETETAMAAGATETR